MADALCKICSISAARVLRKTDAGVVAVPDRTVRAGHIMVVSATHARSFSDLKPVEADAFMSLVSTAARAAEQASGAERYYVLRIGDKLAHLHFHLVPRAEGDDSLAPFVFGESGWAARVRADAMPPVELFEKAFSQTLRLDSIQHRATKDAGRLPAWLVGMTLSLLAGSIIFAMAWPFFGPVATPATAVGAAIATGQALDDRMMGRRIRWWNVVLTSAIFGAFFAAFYYWMRT